MVSFKKAFIALALLSTAFVLPACSGGGGGSGAPIEAPQDDDYSKYNEASCQFKFDEGEVVVASSSRNVRNTFFQKNVDLSLLRPVLAASGKELVRFAGDNGVKFYTTTRRRSANTCEFLSSVPGAPSDLNNAFNQASGGSSSTDLLGVYWAKDTPGLPSTSQNAAIIVRRDVNKWVLMHEYMHHLYRLQAAEEGQMEGTRLQIQLQTVANEYERLEKNIRYATAENRKAAIDAAAVKLVELTSGYLEVVRQYMLEEMSIESVLAQNVSLMKYITKEQQINGSVYIISSAQRARERMQTITSAIYDFQYRYRTEMAYNYSNDLSKVNSRWSQMQSEMAPLEAKAHSHLRENGLSLKGFIAAMTGNAEHGPGCSHGETEILDETIDRVLE